MARQETKRESTFSVQLGNRNYTLCILNGKPIRIDFYDSCGGSSIYPSRQNFDYLCEQIVNELCSKKEAYSLKSLYDCLEEGFLKSLVKHHIDEMIVYFEKALSNLKS